MLVLHAIDLKCSFSEITNIHKDIIWQAHGIGVGDYSSVKIWLGIKWLDIHVDVVIIT